MALEMVSEEKHEFLDGVYRDSTVQ